MDRMASGVAQSADEGVGVQVEGIDAAIAEIADEKIVSGPLIPWP